MQRVVLPRLARLLARLPRVPPGAHALMQRAALPLLLPPPQAAAPPWRHLRPPPWLPAALPLLPPQAAPPSLRLLPPPQAAAPCRGCCLGLSSWLLLPSLLLACPLAAASSPFCPTLATTFPARPPLSPQATLKCGLFQRSLPLLAFMLSLQRSLALPWTIMRRCSPQALLALLLPPLLP